MNRSYNASKNYSLDEADFTSINKTASRDPDRTRVSVEDGDREAVAVLSNTATNNSINGEVKFLRWGVDSLYLSYQGNLHPEINEQLIQLKRQAQSEKQNDQAKAQIKIGDHLFEVKDKGTSMFAYILEDNAFRIQLSRPNKAVPMAYVKLSSEYLTHLLPAEAEKRLSTILSQLGALESTANVSRIDMFVDFVSFQDMEAWKRDAWVTRAASVTAYAIDNRFTGWAIGLGGVMAGRLYDKLFEITKSNKGYLIPLWQSGGWQAGEPIWRLEFEFKREMLVQKDLSKLTDVLANMNGLWSYATTEWLKLTLPSPEDKTRSRWAIHPLWSALATLDWETSGGVLKQRFSNDRAPNDQAALNRGFSAVTTWMAANGYRDYETAIHPFFMALDSFVNNRAMDFGMGFEELVTEKVSTKARRFNTLDNNEPLAPTDSEKDVDRDSYRKASNGS
jgi:hypothetical protein